jgi:hypothetical protein
MSFNEERSIEFSTIYLTQKKAALLSISKETICIYRLMSSYDSDDSLGDGNPRGLIN